MIYCLESVKLLIEFKPKRQTVHPSLETFIAFPLAGFLSCSKHLYKLLPSPSLSPFPTYLLPDGDPLV